MANKDYRDNKRSSVCETSMLLVANIIRLSSLRFSGHGFTQDLELPQEEETYVRKANESSSVSKYYKSERTYQDPERTKTSGSYVMKPSKEDPTTYVSQELDNVDVNAENYICHVRGMIRKSDDIEY